MQTLYSESDLQEMCAEVFEQASLTKTQVSEAMNVSNAAVHYMIKQPEKSMSTLRTRFLREVAGMTVEGPGYYVDGDGKITLDEATEVFDLTTEEVTALIEDDKVETDEDGGIVYASLYAFLLTLREEQEEAATEQS